MEQNVKKGNKVKIAIILVVIIICAILVFFLINKVDEKVLNKPEDKLKTYMAYICDEKYSEMYNMLTSEVKSNISEEDFIKRNKNIYSSIEANNIELSNITEETLDNRKYKTFIYK